MRWTSRDFVLLGYSLALAMAAVFLCIFFVAYAGGYKAVVDVNRYGEATLEFFLAVFCIPFMVYGYVLLWLEDDSDETWRRKR